MAKPKLAYVDHSFHKKTKSTFFLRDILSEHYEVINVWDESWQTGVNLTATEVNGVGADYVLFFQTLLPTQEFSKISGKIIIVPMADATHWIADYYWYTLSAIPMKVLSFSESLSSKLRHIGFDVLSLQYFFDPALFPALVPDQGKKIFFWQRADITFADVKKLIGQQQIDKLVLRIDADPGYTPNLPTPAEVKQYNIEVINWAVSREEYLQKLAECTIFIAPRKHEGIGMSFIEAMTMGLAVAAYHQPTMNEYVTPGTTGWLFTTPKPLSLESYQQLGSAAKTYCQAGFERWQRDIQKIQPFISTNYIQPIKHSWIVLSYFRIAALYKKIFLLYTYFRKRLSI